MLILGIFLIIYGVACIVLGLIKPEKVWQMGKIQAFVKILGNLGTTIFFCLWGAVALGLGIYFTVINL